MLAVGDMAGCGNLGLSEAKRSLRSLGPEGTTMATRLGRLSKYRNTKCHPDTGLLRAEGKLLVAPAKQSSSTTTEWYPLITIGFHHSHVFIGWHNSIPTIML